MEGLLSTDLAGVTGDIDHERRLSRLGAEVARVAHELNTPVSLIAGSLANLDQHVAALLHYVTVSRAYTAQHPELARAYEESRIDYVLKNSTNLLAICDEGVERLRHITAQLRGYGRRGDGPARAAAVLVDILRSAERMARGAHPGAPLVERTMPAEPVQVVGDEQMLLPALVNIIGNAFDAVAGRPGPRVTIVVRRDQAGYVEVSIRDNGPGIPAALRDRVFDPFFTTKRPGEGVGLGLAIARETIEAMDGTIELGTTAEGAVFVLRLPAA